MKWYPYLYVGEGASKKKNKIIRKLKIGAGMIDVWVITDEVYEHIVYQMAEETYRETGNGDILRYLKSRCSERQGRLM